MGVKREKGRVDIMMEEMTKGDGQSIRSREEEEDEKGRIFVDLSS